MKIINPVLFLFLLSVADGLKAQPSGKKCEPAEVVFKDFQKSKLVFLAGVSGTRTKADKKNYYGYGLSAGLSYFPLDYFEVGYRFNPWYSNYDNVGKKLLAEHNLYTAYHYFRMNCYRLIVSAGAGIVQDGSEYTVKGESVSRSKIFFYLNPVDARIILGSWGQVRVHSEFFVNGRPPKHNLGIAFNIAGYKL